MASFSNSNTPGFRTPPLEDLPQDPDPNVTSISVLRVVFELKFLASVVAAIYVQRSGTIHQIETIANVPKVVVLVAGAWTLGKNVAHLFYDPVFAPKFLDLSSSPQLTRRRRRRVGL
jgi:hypothetical protein